MPDRFSHTVLNAKGSATPDRVNPGLAGVKSEGGDSASPRTDTPSGSASFPSGVDERDGTQMMTETRHTSNVRTSGPSSGKDNIPPKVSRFPVRKP